MLYKTNTTERQAMNARFHDAHLAVFGHDYLYDFVQDPLWYQKFDRLAKTRILGATAVGSFRSAKSIKDVARESRERLYAMFEDLLEHGDVALGQPDQGLYEWDSERLDPDTIVIHHSNRAQGISLPRLNAMELLRLYVPAYQQPADDDIAKVKGKPIYSGHFRSGRQHFFPYHWIIRQDGTSERLLEDHEWGWHAGNLDVNRRSIGICFDDDLSHKAPNDAMIAEARRIMREYYPWIRPTTTNVVSHEAVSKLPTACPGEQFASGTQWKTSLIRTK
jgi:hypothetical protein